jgi:hypothetical protein
VDDTGDIARVGLRLLASRRAAKLGLTALERQNRKAFDRWREFIQS